MKNSIQLSKHGHDGFIDFLKAYCIICVILAHSIPDHNSVAFCIWGGMQVPIFLLIQVFHALKKDSQEINFTKIFRRIILPFIAVETFLFLFKIGIRIGKPEEISKFIKTFIYFGGYGPGSYYFWIYLQFVILLPFFAPLFKKYKESTLLLFFLVLSVGGEFFCSLTHMPEFIYRLLALRYIFLIFLGYIWVKKGIIINTFTLLLSIISMGSILFFSYTNYNLEPFFFQTNWKCHRWICYFYASNLLIFILYQLFNLLSHHAKIMSFISRIGQDSWEIFLAQICIFSIIPNHLFSFIGNYWIKNFLWIIFTLIFGIILGHYFKFFYSLLKKSHK